METKRTRNQLGYEITIKYNKAYNSDITPWGVMVRRPHGEVVDIGAGTDGFYYWFTERGAKRKGIRAAKKDARQYERKKRNGIQETFTV